MGVNEKREAVDENIASLKFAAGIIISDKNNQKAAGFHFTRLRKLGWVQNRFTFRFQGLNPKPTGVEPATAVKGILV